MDNQHQKLKHPRSKVKHGYGAGASYQEGGPVAPEGGQVEGDEFVIPAHVAKYLGEKFLNDLVAKAEAEMGVGGEAEGPIGALAEETPGSPM